MLGNTIHGFRNASKEYVQKWGEIFIREKEKITARVTEAFLISALILISVYF